MTTAQPMSADEPKMGLSEVTREHDRFAGKIIDVRLRKLNNRQAVAERIRIALEHGLEEEFWYAY